MSKARELLREVYDRRGELTPAIVVEEARPAGSPLHDLVFDRPVEEAAEAYFLARAHHLIQQVRVQIARVEQPPLNARYWVALPSAIRPFEFVPIDIVAQDAQKVRAAKQEAQRRIVMARNALKTLSDAVAAINSQPDEQLLMADMLLVQASEAIQL